MNAFSLPDLGEGLAESEIIKWHVDVGDRVDIDQIVLTVETEKAVVEVPAPCSGVIISRHGQVGDVLGVGSLLLEIDDHNQAHQSRSETEKDAATVVGNVAMQSCSIDVDQFWVGHQDASPESRISALPSARVLAQKLGVNLAKTKGSGPDGIIVDKDIYRECDRQRPGTEVLKGARRTMVTTMAESHKHVAAVTITEEALLSEWDKDEDISSRLIRAVVYACKEEPALNAWFDVQTMTRCVHNHVNIGIAVDSAHGLYVPVLRKADQYDTPQLRDWLDRTVQGIRDRTIGREQLQHATITLSNFGAIAGLFATPVVTPPQVAIIGAGRIVEKVVLKDGKAVGVNCMPLSITFDHRACTGGEAARFVRALTQDLQMKR